MAQMRPMTGSEVESGFTGTSGSSLWYCMTSRATSESTPSAIGIHTMGAVHSWAASPKTP